MDPNLIKTYEIFNKTYSNVISHKWRADEPWISVGDKQFAKPIDAMQYVRNLGIKTVDVFRPGMKTFEFPGSGPNFFGDLESIVKDTGLTIIKTTHKTDVDLGKNLERELIRGNKRYGFINPDRETTTVLRFLKDGNELTYDEILSKLKGLGMTFGDLKDTRFSKRFKSVLSARMHAGVFDKATSVHTFDPLDYLQSSGSGIYSAEEAKAAFDGISHLNPKYVQGIAKQLENRAKTIQREIKGLPAGSEERLEALGRIRGHLSQAAELRKVAREGGRFNARVYGMDGIDGMVKGDVLVPSLKNWAAAAKEFGASSNVDFITAATNLTKQFGWNGANHFRGGRRAGRITLEMRKTSTNAFLDDQSFLANPDLYDIRDLEANTRRYVDQFYSELVATGQLKPGFLSHLRELAYRSAPDNMTADQIINFNKQKNLAENIVSSLNSGMDIRNDPGLLEMVNRSLRGYLRSPKDKNIPHFLLPNTLTAEITPWSAAHAADRSIGRLADNQLDFHPAFGWVMSDRGATIYHRVFGGFDFDDTLRNSLRSNHGKIFVAGQRSPTAFGENAVFELSSPNAIEEVLRHNLSSLNPAEANMLTMINRKRRLTRQADRLERKMSRKRIASNPIALDRYKAIRDARLNEIGTLQHAIGRDAPGFITPIDDGVLEALRGRSLASGETQKFLRYWDEVSEGRQKEIEKILDKQLDDFTARNLPGHLQILRLNQIGETKNLLETYSLTRMLSDSGLHSNTPEAIEAALHSGWKGFKVTSQESYIDAMINPGAADLSKLGETPQGIIDALQESIAEAAAHGLKFDPARMDKIYDKKFLESKLNERGLSIEGILLERTDPKAFYSGAQSIFEDVITDTFAQGKGVVKQHPFISEIMDTAFTPEEMAHGKNIIEEWNKGLEEARGMPDSVREMQIDSFGEELPFFTPETKAAERVKRYLGQFTEEDGSLGERGFRVIGAHLQQTADMGQHFRIMQDTSMSREIPRSLLDIKHQVMSWFLTKGGDAEKIKSLQLAPEQERNLRGVLRSRTYLPKGETAQVAEEVLREGKQATFDTIKLAKIKELWEHNATFRGGALALGGLALFGEVYKHFAMGRSHSDMQGPPLLPGGSAYEELTQPDLINNMYEYQRPNSQGMTYRVSGTTSGDPMAFQRAAQGISGGQSSGTISNKRQTPATKDIWNLVSTTFGALSPP